MAAADIKLADYLFARLRQLGVQSIFGVPGDFNLRLLDFVTPAGLHWVGNCNELNAAYAADGYGRINGLAAVITTFGVGELSALNGIAGAYAEKTPVVHIVGTPPRAVQSARTFVHHTFSDGDFRRFAAMSTHITAAQTNLTDSATAPERIDWILQQALVHSRPVYLEIPHDMNDVLVSAANLNSPIHVPETPRAAHEPKVVAGVLDRVYSAQRPLILVDGESESLNILEQIDTLVQTTGWPTWTSIFGKSLVNEQHPNVYGLYAGAYGDPQAKEYYDGADLVIVLGPHYSDTNTFLFSTIAPSAVRVSFSETTVQIGNDTYHDVSPRSVLSQVLQTLDVSRISRPKSLPSKPKISTADIPSTDLIAQKTFFRLVNPLFREGDIILTETGTASHGGSGFRLPAKSRIFGAVTWLSIGFMLPATLGAALAHRELNASASASAKTDSQVILFIGDGSLQMTAQEISVMIREKLRIVIFILNNDGYTIERVIHGRKQAYNDVPFWRHTQALNYFGADEDHVAGNTFTARTCGELQTVLADERIQRGEGLRIVEVFMGREDVQGVLLDLLNRQVARSSSCPHRLE
ncbi:Thiamine pyrophosphate enzyme [Penicillium alfredii]|uniref:Pyruvate decarboxylase n=1 Tax=Penicillium alfredii TaxID=1506179 RepID=A0A9W9K7L6_9EURO|nr:Thiamine pyrophosphate enzyme [Penicillium alfredii]KAJ5095446.1 Thiamine pyrophosphate enzyme [Penicillium alfredii]